MAKTLVAYFSCSGVTKELAVKLAKASGADIFEIVPETPYTASDLDWTDKHSRSTVEMNDKQSRPPIKGKIQNFESYNTVFIGFPIWWYVAPTIINTFLESYDFSGKTVVPFATSGSSGVGDSDRQLRISCSEKTLWKPAKRFARSTTEADLSQWIKSLNL